MADAYSWFLDDKKLLVSQGPICKAVQWNLSEEEMLQTSLQGRLSLGLGHPVHTWFGSTLNEAGVLVVLW